MSRIEILNSETHRDVRIRSKFDAAASGAVHFQRIVLGEFAQAALQHPLLFAKDAETGAFFAGAMMGFKPDENLFFRDGRNAGYLTLGARRQGFFIAGDHVALDPEHVRVGVDEGEALFDYDGQPSAFLRGIQSALTQLNAGLEPTNAFIATMLKLELIEPIDVTLNFDDGERFRLDGLYTISNDALRDLSDSDILALYRSGYLQLAHLVIGSLKQIPLLARERNDRLLMSA